jgi:hypothetical protein
VERNNSLRPRQQRAPTMRAPKTDQQSDVFSHTLSQKRSGTRGGDRPNQPAAAADINL